jgi:ribosomal protein L16 Arg81 hydroxylase
MEPTLEMCSCRGIEPLPLNCFETGMKIDGRIEKQEKTLKEWQGIIKEAKKQTKNDKETMQLLNNMHNDDKQELEQLKKNRLEYMERCEENK